MKIPNVLLSLFLFDTVSMFRRQRELQDLEIEIKLVIDKKAKENLKHSKKKSTNLLSQRPQKPRIKRSGTREGKNSINKK